MASRASRTKKGKGIASSSRTPRLPGNFMESLGKGAKKRYDTLSQLIIKPNKCIVMGSLLYVGLKDKVWSYLTRVGWLRFAVIQEPCYKELFLEFLATFSLGSDSPYLQNPDCLVKFRLGGQNFEMSMTEFGVSCGFYLEEEVQSEAYTNAIWDKPASVTYSYMWDGLTTDGGIYNPSQSKSSKLTHPAIRFIHRFMSFTVTGRGGASNGVVSQVDLLCLYAMHVGWTCNLGVLFGRYFHHSSMKKKGSLLGGSYVTRLARNLGVLEPVQRWTKLHEMEVMGIDIMRSIHIVDSDFRVIGQEGEAAQEPPQADEHEGGVDPEPANVPQQPFDLEAAIHGLQQDQTQLRNDVEAIRAQNLQQQQQMDQQSRHIRWMRDAMHQFFQQGNYHIDPPPPSPGGN